MGGSPILRKNIYKLHHPYTTGGSGDKLLLNSHTPMSPGSPLSTKIKKKI